MIRFICAHCGNFATSTVENDEILDSGTTLTCDECGKDSVVDIDTPERRAARFGVAFAFKGKS